MEIGRKHTLRIFLVSFMLQGISSLQCPSCDHVTVTDVPSIVKTVVDSALGLFQDVKCSQPLTGPIPEIREETCPVEPGKVSRCSWYKGTLTMEVPLIGTKIPFHVSKRGCYQAAAAAIPANRCHDLEDLSEDRSALEEILDKLTSALDVHSFVGQRCLCSDTYCATSSANHLYQGPLNFVMFCAIVTLLSKYL